MLEEWFPDGESKGLEISLRTSTIPSFQSSTTSCMTLAMEHQRILFQQMSEEKMAEVNGNRTHPGLLRTPHWF